MEEDFEGIREAAGAAVKKEKKRGRMQRLWFAIVGAPALLLAQSGASYHVTHTYPLGGDGSWDYVVPDPASHRLYIARQNRVMVVDEDKGTVIGEVSGINGAHGTAVGASSCRACFTMRWKRCESS